MYTLNRLDVSFYESGKDTVVFLSDSKQTYLLAGQCGNLISFLKEKVAGDCFSEDELLTHLQTCDDQPPAFLLKQLVELEILSDAA